MADPVLPDTLHPHRAKEFFLARQPILNRDQVLVAYELLFRRAADGPANVVDDLAATASVIAHASELGLENVIGGALAFVNIDAMVLMSDIIGFLPREKVVLEILETVEVTERIVARVAELKRDGYRFALDDVIATSENVEKLLPHVDLIKIDMAGTLEPELKTLVARFRRENKKLLAEKVESLDQFRYCMDLGFDYFQGYHFAQPLVLSGKKLSPSQLTIMEVLGQILADADTAEIERTIKKDASFGLMLLRLVKTPAAGISQRIDSLSQAVSHLGREQLQRWLQILLYAEPGKPHHAASPLLALATTRGKLLELIAQQLPSSNRHMADIAFTVGIMSLMDALFGWPMEQILARISVADEVRDALLARKGIYGDMLRLVECIEHIEENGPQVVPLLKKLGLSGDDFYALQLSAFEWSNSIAVNAG